MSIVHIPSQKSQRIQLGVELAMMCVLLVASLSAFGTSGIGVACAFAVAYGVPRWLYARLSGGEEKGALVLAAAGLALVVWAFCNIYGWTEAVGHALSNPEISSDDNSYFRWALHYYDGSVEEIDTKFIGFPLMILISWQIFGVSIVWPIAINVMLTLLTIVLTGQMAGRALEGRVKADRPYITFLAMLGTVLLCYWMSHGAMLLKEPLTYFAVALAAYAIARMKAVRAESGGRMWTDIALFVIAIAILSISRTGVIYFVMAGVALALIDNRRMWRYGTTLMGISLVGIGMGIYWSNGFSAEVQMRIVAGANAGGDIMHHVYKAHGAYGEAMSHYFALPAWQKLLLLPVTCIVQLFIPFPWPSVEGLSIGSLATRFQWGWYAIAGVALFYIFRLSWKKQSLGWWALWPFVCFAAAAFSTGGAVSRYILPYQPLFVVVAVWVVCKYREGQWRRSFRIWLATYALVVAAILLYCYFQTQS